MEFFDKNMTEVFSGDILKFDNGNKYLVYTYNNHFIMQNIKKYTLPLNLKIVAPTGMISSAVKLTNIYDL